MDDTRSPENPRCQVPELRSNKLGRDAFTALRPAKASSEVCMQTFIANLSNELKNYPEKGRESPNKFFCRCGEFLVVLSFSFLSEFRFCVRKLFLLPAVLELKCRVA